MPAHRYECAALKLHHKHLIEKMKFLSLELAGVKLECNSYKNWKLCIFPEECLMSHSRGNPKEGLLHVNSKIE